MNWRPMVFVEGSWAGNGLVFASKEEAEANARDLMGRWMLVDNYKAQETEAPVNYRWVGGKLEAV